MVNIVKIIYIVKSKTCPGSSRPELCLKGTQSSAGTNQECVKAAAAAAAAVVAGRPRAPV